MEIIPIEFDNFVERASLIQEDTQITAKCNFGDDMWDISNRKNDRRNSIGLSKQRFNWEDMRDKIGDDFIHELKVLTYLLLFVPDFFKRNKTQGMYKVSTVNAIINKMVNVVEEILLLHQNDIGTTSFVNISCFGQLTLKDFERIPIHTSRINEIKRCLRYLANPLLQSYLIQPVSWNENDIKTLSIHALEKCDEKKRSSQPIDEGLYLELIRHVTVDIVSFKKAMKLKVNSKVTNNMLSEIERKKYDFDISKAFEDYIEIRKKGKSYSIKSAKRSHNTQIERLRFKSEHGITLQGFFNELRNVQRAAIMAILLFTGVRYSELISFKNNCIVKRKDVYVLKGTVIKNKSDLLPSDIDEWVAIPIVRDAVELLENIQRFTFNSYIVASLNSVYLDKENFPLSLSGVTDTLNLYVTSNSEFNTSLRKYSNNPEHKITVHRLRHSLAQQLIRGRLGLPYISYHLKHVNTAVVAYNRVSNVTLGYGGISREIVNSAKQYQSVKKELIEEIYHPSAVVAGGNNAKDFTKRKKEYFQGLMVDDDEVEEVINDLKDQSLPFIDVGLGYCGGRKDIVMQDGSKQAPPCIGQLKCNPVDCGNAVIPKSKVPIWKRVYEDTVKKLQDDSFKYMELELQETLTRAKQVINHFHPRKEK